MAHQVFISFSSKDVEVATRIRDGLEARHIPCWMSTRDVPVGADFQESIIDALEKAKVMVLVFSTNANNSKEMKKELVLAGEYELPVLPVRIEKVLPSGAFRFQFTTRQYLDLFEDWDTNLSKLAGQIMQTSASQMLHPPPPPPSPPPPPPPEKPQTPQSPKAPVDEGGGLPAPPPKAKPWARLAVMAVAGAAVVVLWAESHSDDAPVEDATTASPEASAPAAASASTEPPAVFSTEGVPVVGWGGFSYIPVTIGTDPADAAKSVFGMHITKIAKGSPAEHAGLLAKDVITAIDGKPLKTKTAWLATVRESSPGQTFKLGLERNGDHIDLALVLGDVRQAVAQGNATALVYVGYLFLEGSKTVSVDYAQALAWFKQAEALGAPDAMVALGTMFQEGKGVPKDDKQALAWFQKAAEHDHPVAQTFMGNAYRDGAGVVQNAATAFDFYQKAAAGDEPAAMRNLGDFYANGVATARDDKQAPYWYTKAANQDDAVAMTGLGSLYVIGAGVPQDFVTAWKWLYKGATLGDATAMHMLGRMAGHGLGVSQDYALAQTWFREAIKYDYAPAMVDLGVYREDGLGGAQDYGEALGWYLKAAQLGNGEGARRAALLYANDKVAAPTPDAVLKWMRFAAGRGDEVAKQWMGTNGYN